MGIRIDDATGVVTFSSAPANAAVIAVDCEFDIPARFDMDALNATIDTYNSYSWLDIPLVELRVGS